jgi:hypothetical protein
VVARWPAPGQFRRPHHRASAISEQGDPGDLAARMDLEPEREDLQALDGRFQDRCAAIPFEHRRLAAVQQQACPARMHRIERLLLPVQHQDVAHTRASPRGGKGDLDQRLQRFGVHHTSFTHSSWFMLHASCRGLAAHPLVPRFAGSAGVIWPLCKPPAWHAGGMTFSREPADWKATRSAA